MKQFQHYSIEFLYDGDPEPRVERFDAASPGHAFQKCHRKFPKAKLLRGFLQGKIGNHWCSITYQAPSMARIETQPEAKADDLTFPFFDECLSSPRSIVPKKKGSVTWEKKNCLQEFAKSSQTQLFYQTGNEQKQIQTEERKTLRSVR